MRFQVLLLALATPLPILAAPISTSSPEVLEPEVKTRGFGLMTFEEPQTAPETDSEVKTAGYGIFRVKERDGGAIH